MDDCMQPTVHLASALQAIDMIPCCDGARLSSHFLPSVTHNAGELAEQPVAMDERSQERSQKIKGAASTK